MQGRSFLALPAVLVFGIACVTINVYFPETEIQDLSRKIEEEVQKEAAEPEQDGEGEAKPDAGSTGPQDRGSASPGMFDLLLGATPAYAQAVPEPEVSSPAIRAIIVSRAARLARVNDFKSRGYIGENNRALLESRNLGQLSDLQARAELNTLVRDENQDRTKLFAEIAATKGVDDSQIPRVAETYAATLRSQARPGDWIQMADGSWTQK